MGYKTLRIFIGYDPRQPMAFQVLCHSIWKRATKPVSITRLQLDQLPLKREGLTQFTYSRYLVPYLCGYEGTALFMDADMLALADITQIPDPVGAVSVVKNVRRFEWPSLMYFDCARCKSLTLESIENGKPWKLGWADSVSELPSEWNHLVGYDAPRPDAKIVHFTMGIPFWQETRNSEYASEWMADAKESMSTVSWKELMGQSVHAAVVLQQNAVAA